MSGRKKLIHPLPEVCHSRRCSQDLMVFLLCFLTSPHLWSIKPPGIQTLIRWLFWGASLSFLSLLAPQIKSLPCLNASLLGFIGCRAICRASLDLVTIGKQPHALIISSDGWNERVVSGCSTSQRQSWLRRVTKVHPGENTQKLLAKGPSKDKDALDEIL